MRPEKKVETPSYVADLMRLAAPVIEAVDQSIAQSADKAKDLAWLKQIEESLAQHTPLTGHIIAPVKGGFAVELFASDTESDFGVRAFLPQGLASLRTLNAHLAELEANEFVVREYNHKTGSIIVSRREILLKEKEAQREVFWQKAEVGQEVVGAVKAIMPYGVLLEVEGASGLLHVSDMAWDKQPRPAEVFHMGQELKVKIIELDRESRKFKLGLKQLTQNPWTTIEDQYPIGSDVDGVIVALADFGAFVRLPDGIEGLIHVSEISYNRVKHPTQHFHIGDTVRARVLHVDAQAKRISLSTKALEKNPLEKMQEAQPVGSIIKAKIASIKEFGLFLDFDKNITGFVHVSELSWTKRIEDPAELFEVDQEIEVKITGYEFDRQRVLASVKRLKDDPWAAWKQKYAKGTRHTAVIKRVLNQGAECELEPDLIAFCPLRELSAESGVERAKDAVRVGQSLEVEVLSMEPHEMRVVVSVRARQMHETKEDYESYLERQEQEGATGRVTLADAISSHKPTE